MNNVFAAKVVNYLTPQQVFTKNLFLPNQTNHNKKNKRQNI
jgi:hypothetical protein